MPEEKEPKQPLKDVTPATENKDLVSDVEKRLNETFGETPAENLKDKDDSTPDDRDKKDDDQAVDSKSKDDSTPEVKDEDDKEEGGEKDRDENKDAPSKSDEKGDDKTEKEYNLPDAFHRAAEHDGWKPEDIKEFFEGNPERALVTFQNIYNSMNRASRDFANLGRRKAEETRQQAEAIAKAEAKLKSDAEAEKAKKEAAKK